MGERGRGSIDGVGRIGDGNGGGRGGSRGRGKGRKYGCVDGVGWKETEGKGRERKRECGWSGVGGVEGKRKGEQRREWTRKWEGG